MAALPQPWKALSDRIYAIEENIKRIQQSFSSFLAGMGFSVPSPGTTQVDGNFIVQGNFTANAKISLAALVNPVSFDGAGGAVTNFALSTTGSGVALGVVTNTVPAGMTKMASIVIGNVTAVNPTASLDYLECRVGIIDPNSVNYPGNTQFQPISGSSGSGHVSASKYGLLTGLSGGMTVQHYVSAWSANANWAANASNIADLQVLIFWGA